MKPGIDLLPALLATDVKCYFQQMVEHYQHKLYAFAYRLTDSQHDAEDIVQESFVRAYVALVTYPLTSPKLLIPVPKEESNPSVPRSVTLYRDGGGMVSVMTLAANDLPLAINSKAEHTMRELAFMVLKGGTNLAPTMSGRRNIRSSTRHTKALSESR